MSMYYQAGAFYAEYKEGGKRKVHGVAAGLGDDYHKYTISVAEGQIDVTVDGKHVKKLPTSKKMTIKTIEFYSNRSSNIFVVDWCHAEEIK